MSYRLFLQFFRLLISGHRILVSLSFYWFSTELIPRLYLMEIRLIVEYHALVYFLDEVSVIIFCVPSIYVPELFLTDLRNRDFSEHAFLTLYPVLFSAYVIAMVQSLQLRCLILVC